MNSYSIVVILIHWNLLEQSGQRPGGNHLPVPPQIQNAYGGRRWLKSHWSLHNGLHIRPKFQSSQAFAPFLGGGKSGHSLAKMNINENHSICKPFKKAENYDMYSCVYNQWHKRWFPWLKNNVSNWRMYFVAVVVCLFVCLFKFWFIFLYMYFLVQFNKNFRPISVLKFGILLRLIQLSDRFSRKTDNQTNKQTNYKPTAKFLAGRRQICWSPPSHKVVLYIMSVYLLNRY